MYTCVQFVCMVPVKASNPCELELEVACDRWGLSSGPPEERPVLLTTEPSSQSLLLHFT